jgi:uncharacterized protein YjdB
VSGLATSFKTVVVPVGGTLTVPFAVRSAAGTPAGKAKVTWRSSKPKVASVKKKVKSGTVTWPVPGKGKLKVKAFKSGQSKIQLTAPGGAKLTLVVKAVQKTKAVKARKATLKTKTKTLRVGQSLTLKAKVTPKGAAKVVATWRSTKPSVAIVDAAGKVTAKAAGRAVIVGKIGGKTVKRALTVR